ncbi:hypothetical protein P4O66_004683 [Electrophorus voltai]|uniref:Reverse transcriptase domain-containing protein n=1 Tax=Electrophorus voltai TaxID=2609070 RepID=A0AAD8ZP81_9TELE|nr:hypothetical protein P4O66_004683 [Electrophorus voltai]
MSSVGNASLADELNFFFARYDVKTAETDTLTPPSSNSHFSTVQEHEMRRVLKAVFPRKGASPDGVSGRVLKECADQLSEVFMKIFNLSLSKSIIPPCLKSATIITLPKKTAISSFNDYCPVALTPVIIKLFERQVLQHIKASLPFTFRPHQLASRANRSTDDAISTALHTAPSHLEHQGKFVDNTTVVGLILGEDETACRDEVQGLARWCSKNNLILNSSKTKELIIDFRKQTLTHSTSKGTG